MSYKTVAEKPTGGEKLFDQKGALGIPTEYRRNTEEKMATDL